ncbi:MAG: biotin--[acetyl-CoA-carboxylase] ligase [Alphaproteobacteria bacterium]
MKWQHYKFDVLSSTQSHLQALVNETPNLPEGYVVQAGKQTSGYGRHGRDWEEGEGNLYTSFLLRPDCSVSAIGEVSLLSGVALANTFRKHIKTPPIYLKWPNDVLIEYKKCSGILIDSGSIHDGLIPYLIIGVGVNVKAAPLKESSHLQHYLTDDINADTVLSDLRQEFSTLYEQWKREGFTPIRDKWLKNSFPVGTRVSVKIKDNKITGKFQTIDNTGALVITCDNSNKTKTITAGDVFINE